MLRMFVASVIVLMTSSAFAAPCPKPTFTSGEKISTSASAVMLVTHPSTLWDGRFSSKAGMDAAVKFAKEKSLPVVYLHGESDNDTYFFSDCNPTYWYRSMGGEFDFPIHSAHIYSVGGHWELCQANSMRDVMSHWVPPAGVNITLTQVLDGLYAYGAYVEKADPYFSEFERFMEIIYYGNPRNDWYSRKLSMLELMGVIKNENLQIEYLKRNLPPFHARFKSYRVELVYNGKVVEVLNEGSPTLRYEFVNSLYTGGPFPAKP